MRRRSRPLVAKLGLATILVGSVFATTAVFHLESDYWIALVSAAAVGGGVFLVIVACRQALYLWVLIERIVLVVVSGVLIPVAGLAMYSAAQADSWLWRAAAFFTLSLVLVWIAGRVPLNIDSWFDESSAMPPNKSLERTRDR